MGLERWRGEETGSLSLETAAVAPVVLLFFTFVIAVGTLQNAHGTMDAATQAAARTASITRPSDAPQSKGETAADVVFNEEGLSQCTGSVKVGRPGRGLVKPPGYDSVTAVGRCRVRISFGIFSLTRTVSSTFTSVVDTYRGP
ncbi:TadE/TadG family type IV pilus assembly protein [Streptacidiphilus jiangxiensis]|uniref:TadE-like protein n=1 Tax=Streptacidiphilus jiangxiensis TaxID=235985 RepID=A0A1H7T7C1_STRJI|nr:TadE/TadG family type IV pilus assembly protein [Streptacidiphilus jiangxiensis]SEL80176.1 TadE-like protein [Streptacidiphilus jiangxiensis]